MKARITAQNLNIHAFKDAAKQIMAADWAKYYDPKYAFRHIAITERAYHEPEEKQLIGYISYCNKYVTNKDIRDLLLYAAFCVLEDISYTRKDGQYLRWDQRSGRSQGKTAFTKPTILTFKGSDPKQNKPDSG